MRRGVRPETNELVRHRSVEASAAAFPPGSEPIEGDPESAPRKRFRLEKIEERIAPRRFRIEKFEDRMAPKGASYGNGAYFNPHGKLVGTGGGSLLSY